MFNIWNDIVKDCVQTVITKDKDGNVTSIVKDVATLSCIPAIFLNVLGALLMFAGLTALIMFIIGSFKYMDSEGDPKKIEGAKHNFEFGITGLAIVVFSFAIISIISIVTRTPCIVRFGFGCSTSTSAPTPAPSPTPILNGVCGYIPPLSNDSARRFYCVNHPNLPANSCEWAKKSAGAEICRQVTDVCNTSLGDVEVYTPTQGYLVNICSASSPTCGQYADDCSQCINAPISCGWAVESGPMDNGTCIPAPQVCDGTFSWYTKQVDVPTNCSVDECAEP